MKVPPVGTEYPSHELTQTEQRRSLGDLRRPNEKGPVLLPGRGSGSSTEPPGIYALFGYALHRVKNRLVNSFD